MDSLPEDLWRLIFEHLTVSEVESLRSMCRCGAAIDLQGRNGVLPYLTACRDDGVEPELFDVIPPRELAKRIRTQRCVGCGEGGGEGGGERPLLLVASCCGVRPVRFHQRCIRSFEGTRYVACPRCSEPTVVVRP